MANQISDHQQVDREKILKICIVGKPAVGKTSLRRAFMGQNFRQNYLPTLGADFSLYNTVYKKELIKTTLWDLSGQPRFSKVHPQYYLGAHGLILLYDHMSENPEDEIIQWIDKYLEHVGKYVGMVLIVQNKIDLIDPQNQAMMTSKHDRLVKSISIYYENKIIIQSGRTSALTGEGVKEALEPFIHDISDHLEEQTGSPNPKGSDSANHYTLGSYLVTFENLIGPVIALKSPYAKDMNYSEKEEASIVNLSAGLNLEYLAEQKYQTGTALWMDPESILYYIAFVVENPEARGGYGLYIIGTIVSQDLKYLIADKQSLIEGFLVSKMNQFADFLSSTNYVLSDEQDLIRLYQSNGDLTELQAVLESLRSDVDNLVKEKLNKLSR